MFLGLLRLSSRKNVWKMRSDGGYFERQEAGGVEAKDFQEAFIELARKRMAAAIKHHQARLRKKLMNHFHRRLELNTRSRRSVSPKNRQS